MPWAGRTENVFVFLRSAVCGLKMFFRLLSISQAEAFWSGVGCTFALKCALEQMSALSNSEVNFSVSPIFLGEKERDCCRDICLRFVCLKGRITETDLLCAERSSLRRWFSLKSRSFFRGSHGVQRLCLSILRCLSRNISRLAGEVAMTQTCTQMGL